MMGLNHSELKSACLGYAQAVMWDTRPTDVSHIQAFSELVYQSTLFYVEFIQKQERDPNLLTECIRYLAIAHAIPPMRGDIRFVRNALDILVELACPNGSVTVEQKPFFREIRRGISEAENEADASPRIAPRHG